LEAVGGQLNAFTSKEYTCYYAKVLDEDVDLAIDVLQDMFFNSLFDEKEMEKEKNVVLEEIKMYKDSPDELIHDLFSQQVWNNSPIGKPILGEEETIQHLSREKIIKYLDDNYCPENTVIAVAGKINHEDIIQKLSAFGEFHRQRKQDLGIVPVGTTFRKAIAKDTEQMHLIVGVPGLGQDDDDIYPLHIINNILGGGLSSRLFQEIREQRGLAYSVFSYHSTYVDSGLFSVYAGTRPANTEEVIKCILNVIKDIKTKGLTEEEITRTKAQIKGNLFLGLESVNSRMSRIGKTELSFGRIKTVDEVVEKLEKVTFKDIDGIMERLWQKDKISMISLGKSENELDYNNIINTMF